MMYEERRKQGYVSEFLSLKCAGDVLNVVSPLGNHASKEITESMAIIKVLRGIVLKDPMKYVVVDLCAGNALTSILAVHLLPVKYAIAVDKRPRGRRWSTAKRFAYCNIDINNLPTVATRTPTVIVAVHPCKDLARKVVELYRNSPTAEYLVMMPCCNGGVGKPEIFTSLEWETWDRYERWCLYLGSMCEDVAHVDVFRDKKCISPKNIIITAKKKGE